GPWRMGALGSAKGPVVSHPVRGQNSQWNCHVLARSFDVRERQDHIVQSANEREFVARDPTIVLQDRADDPTRAVLNHRCERVHPAALPRAYAFDLERRDYRPTALP